CSSRRRVRAASAPSSWASRTRLASPLPAEVRAAAPSSTECRAACSRRATRVYRARRRTDMAKRIPLLSLSLLAVCAALLVAEPLSAQPPVGRGGGGFGGRGGGFGAGRGGGPSDTDTREYDTRDFAGLWSRAPEQYQLPGCPECRDPASWPGYGFFGETPALTPEGQKRFEANKPARGIELGTEEA